MAIAAASNFLQMVMDADKWEIEEALFSASPLYGLRRNGTSSSDVTVASLLDGSSVGPPVVFYVWV